MFIEVIEATYLDGYRVKLLFNNGETRIADLSQSLNGSVFAPLRDIDYFKKNILLKKNSFLQNSNLYFNNTINKQKYKSEVLIIQRQGSKTYSISL